MNSWQFIALGFVLLVTCTAMLKGGAPEKAAGAAMLIASLLSWFMPDRGWLDVQYAILVIDIIMLALLTILALWADRWWPTFAAGFQLLSIVIHLAFGLQQKVISLAYMTALNGIGYLVVATLGLGVIGHVLRQRRMASTRLNPYAG
jgi:hypothetical protein